MVMAKRPRAARVVVLRSIKSMALHLFTKNGYAPTRVEDIAAATGISRRTFFRYFESKEDIIFSWTDDEAFTAWPLLVDGVTREHSWTALRGAFLALATRPESELRQVRQIMTIILQTPILRGRLYNEAAVWQRKLSEVLEETNRGNSLAMLATRTRIAAAVIAYLSAVEEWIEPRSQHSLEALVGAAFDAINFDSFRHEQDAFRVRLPDRRQMD
jgi:AcrR family transcriptional regulator